MKIIEKYSHLNGLEFLLVHSPQLWEEIEGVVGSVDAQKCKTKVSKEKTKNGKILYSPIEMNKIFKERCLHRFHLCRQSLLHKRR